MEQKIKEKSASAYDYMVEMRRHFHRNPEPSGMERNTSIRITEELDKMGIPYEVTENYGVIGHIYGKEGGITVALRADMDALQMEEKNTCEYCSQNPGVMHSCGHDGHMSALLGAAKILAEIKDSFCGEVRLLFQPAEENCQGARQMIAAGALQDVHTIFGMHITLEKPAGSLAFSAGVQTCAADRFQICFRSEGEDITSPLMAAAAGIVALQTLASRQADPKTIFVLSCCNIQGGTKDRPMEVYVEGTCRYSDDALCDVLEEKIDHLIQNIARIYGVKSEVELTHMVAPIVNDQTYSELAKGSVKKLFGSESLFDTSADSVSEDFAEYLRVIKGVYGKLGANFADMSLQLPNHNPGFDFNEEALVYGAAMYVQYALDVLSA